MVDKTLEVQHDIDKCPYCNSGDIYRESSEFDSNGGDEDWLCSDCDRNWSIDYNVEYLYHTVDEPTYKAINRDNQINDILKEI